jgi:ribosomal protein L12E/L44/L45/RPP1/RPP2
MWNQLPQLGARGEWLSLGASVTALFLSAICCLITAIALKRAARAEAIARKVVEAVNDRTSDLDGAIANIERASAAAVHAAGASKESAAASNRAAELAKESMATANRAAESAKELAAQSGPQK